MKALRINGRTLEARAGTVAELLAELGRTEAAGIAVARNGTIVRRAVWRSEPVEDGDDIEIVGAVQGG